MLRYLTYLLAALLGGCALTTNFHMKCDGKCQLEADRNLKLEKEMKQ